MSAHKEKLLQNFVINGSKLKFLKPRDKSNFVLASKEENKKEKSPWNLKKIENQ